MKIHKTLNTHSVTLATLHCSGLSFVVTPLHSHQLAFLFAVSRRMAKHLWHLPRAPSEPVQTSNVRDADNTHYSIMYVLYVCIFKCIGITYTPICSAFLISDFLLEIWYKPGRSTMKDTSTARESRME